MRVPPVERRRRGGFRIRGWMIAVVVVVVVLFLSARGLAGFYTDYLWFDSVGFGSTWRGLLWARFAPTAVFTVLFCGLMCRSPHAPCLVRRFGRLGRLAGVRQAPREPRAVRRRELVVGRRRRLPVHARHVEHERRCGRSSRSGRGEPRRGQPGRPGRHGAAPPRHAGHVPVGRQLWVTTAHFPRAPRSRPRSRRPSRSPAS